MSNIIKEEEKFEEENPEIGNATRVSKISIDDQIDSYLLNYEMMSLVDKDDDQADIDKINEALGLRSLSVLLEEENDENVEEEEPEDLANDQEESEDLETSEELEDSEKEEELVPLIDIDNFVQKVARLATRPEHLLDLEKAIINRALRFLQDNYSVEHVEQAKEILSNNFDIDFNTRFSDSEEIPPAFGSGKGGEAGGGLGGGGA